jgi:hypothetical protein
MFMPSPQVQIPHGENDLDPILQYCQRKKALFADFQTEVWRILPDFCRVVRHFSYESGSVVREMIDSRSPLEIEVLNGLSREDLDALQGFFGEPVKPAGVRIAPELNNHPIIRFLGGAYDEQTVYIKEVTNRIKFYAALWPWHTRPGMTTLHFGVFDTEGGQRASENFKAFLHEIPV